jgi:hypothetical protein
LALVAEYLAFFLDGPFNAPRKHVGTATPYLALAIAADLYAKRIPDRSDRRAVAALESVRRRCRRRRRADRDPACPRNRKGAGTMNQADRPLEERFLDEMVEGYLDGRKADNPEPSANRSNFYRHGFANGRDDLAHSPRLPAQVLRFLADQAIKEDVATARGLPAGPRGAR